MTGESAWGEQSTLGTRSKAWYSIQLVEPFIIVGAKLTGNWVSFPQILRHICELQKNLLMKEEELAEYQNRKLRSLVSHAYQTVPFYRKLFDECGFDPNNVKTASNLSELPIINKRMLRSVPLAQRISCRFIKTPLFPQFTGGSTGEPFAAYLTRDELNLRTAHWLRITLFHERTLLDTLGIAEGLSGRVKQGLHDRLGVFRKIEVPFDIPLNEQVSVIAKEKPELLLGYPSRIYLIASYLESNNLRIFHPKMIFLDSETLFPYMRKKIERVFGLRVTNVYDSYEFGFTAWECREHNGLHINADHQIVEIIGASGEVEDENSGEIVITDLDNYAMPLIRYNTFDIGAKTKRKCRCGLAFPMLKNVTGRKWDFLISPTGETIPPLLVEQFVRKGSEDILEYQITQKSKEALVIDIVVSKQYDYSADARIKAKIQNTYHFKQIDIRHPDQIMKTESGKWRCIVQNC